MRNIVLGGLAAMALGLLFIPAASAAPAAGFALDRGANATTLVDEVRVCRYRRVCSRGRCWSRRVCW